MSVPVALFARVSTKRQDTDRQLHDLAGFAEAQRFEVVATFTEVISGSTRRGQRPQLLELLSLARSGKIRKVVVTEISRLGRRTVEVLNVLDELTEIGVSVFVLNYQMETLLKNGRRNPMAGLMFTLLAEFAQLEKENTVDRINSGLDNARRKGVTLGRKKGTTASDEDVLKKYPKVVRFLQEGQSIRETVLLAKVSDKTVQKVKRLMAKAEQTKKA